MKKKTKNEAAAALGRKARGVKKNLTPEQREFRRQQALALNASLKADPIAAVNRRTARWGNRSPR